MPPSLVIAAWRLVVATLVLRLPGSDPLSAANWFSLGRRQLLLALLSASSWRCTSLPGFLHLNTPPLPVRWCLVSTVPLWVALLAPLTIKSALTDRPRCWWACTLPCGGGIVGLSDACAWQVRAAWPAPAWHEFVRRPGFPVAICWRWPGRSLPPVTC